MERRSITGVVQFLAWLAQACRKASAPHIARSCEFALHGLRTPESKSRRSLAESAGAERHEGALGSFDQTS